MGEVPFKFVRGKSSSFRRSCIVVAFDEMFPYENVLERGLSAGLLSTTFRSQSTNKFSGSLTNSGLVLSGTNLPAFWTWPRTRL
jgi:hypothetical protein